MASDPKYLNSPIGRFEKINLSVGDFLYPGESGRELCNSILCFAMATKNLCGDRVLLFGVVQRVTQTLSPKDMARSPREKQRIREVFEAFLPG